MAGGGFVREPAAESRAEHGSDDNTEAICGHGHGTFLGGKTLEQNGLREGLQCAAASALEYAGQEDDGERRGGSAEKRGNGEDDDAEEEEPLASEAAGEPVGGGEKNGGGHHGGGGEPR